MTANKTATSAHDYFLGLHTFAKALPKQNGAVVPEGKFYCRLGIRGIAFSKEQ
jgi:hypothetical protein